MYADLSKKTHFLQIDFFGGPPRILRHTFNKLFFVMLSSDSPIDPLIQSWISVIWHQEFRLIQRWKTSSDLHVATKKTVTFFSPTCSVFFSNKKPPHTPNKTKKTTTLHLCFWGSSNKKHHQNPSWPVHRDPTIQPPQTDRGFFALKNVDHLELGRLLFPAFDLTFSLESVGPCGLWWWWWWWLLLLLLVVVVVVVGGFLFWAPQKTQFYEWTLDIQKNLLKLTW